MKEKLPSQQQMNLFRKVLKEIINPCYELGCDTSKTGWIIKN